MQDATAPLITKIVAHYQDQDQAWLHLAGRVLQVLHADRSPSRRTLELDVMAFMIDCYTRLGRFDEADEMQKARVMVAHENKIACDTLAEVRHLADAIATEAKLYFAVPAREVA